MRTKNTHRHFSYDISIMYIRYKYVTMKTVKYLFLLPMCSDQILFDNYSS